MDVIVKLIDAINSIDVQNDGQFNGVDVQLLEAVNGALVSKGDVISLDIGSGKDGRQVELRNNSGMIEWRYAGDSTWTELIDLSGVNEEQDIFVDGDTLHDFPVIGDVNRIYYDNSKGDIYRWKVAGTAGYYVMIGWPYPDIIRCEI